MVIRNNVLDLVRPFVGTDVIKVITGVRRSGKSVLLSQIRDLIVSEFDKDAPCFYLDLDDEANAKYLQSGALYAALESELAKHKNRKTYFFLDEVHDAVGWEKAVNSIRKRPNADVYVTGSNSKLLSGELATYLTGRYVEFSLAPFSYAEFLEASNARNSDEAFRIYLEFGGMPFLSELGYRSEPARRYLKDLYGAILLKDVVRRKQIRDVDLLNRIVRYVMTETSHVFSARSIVDFLKSEHCVTAPATVLNYLKACEEAFLISKVEREDLIGKKILSVDEKYYAVDTGLRNANVAFNLSRDIEKLLETVVYTEMKRRGFAINIGRVKGKEVDFVCEKNSERVYIQVAYLMSTEETRDREFSALRLVPDQFEKIVLSMDRFNFSQGGIKHRYLPDFLLGNSSAAI